MSVGFLKYVTHKIIMNETQRENSPTPQRLRGRGVEVSKTLFCFGGILVFCLSVPDNMSRIRSVAKE